MLFESQLHDLYALLPWVSTHKAKGKIRAIDTQKRRILTPEVIKEESEKVVARIEEMQHFRDAKVIMLYYPVHNEVDLRSLVSKYENEKTFLFPALTHRSHHVEARVYEHHTPFVKGAFGIPQPKTQAYKGSIDLILVPGISFDKQHWRVGRGGGYYDRFLKHYLTAFKIGVCYDFQLHEKVPHWLGDKRMDRIITPSQAI
ncbi:MAG: 5-formyltetrahydrofolate cyclo-ligase [Paludibacteraceae bacterium]|nr:5-formyltetrahydrofolate cyclo-ligase [Paludibacteraceae bacterium]